MNYFLEPLPVYVLEQKQKGLGHVLSTQCFETHILKKQIWTTYSDNSVIEDVLPNEYGR